MSMHCNFVLQRRLSAGRTAVSANCKISVQLCLRALPEFCPASTSFNSAANKLINQGGPLSAGKKAVATTAAVAGPTTAVTSPSMAAADAPAQNGQSSGVRQRSVKAELAVLFQEALHKAFPGLDVQAEVTQTNQPKFGDYQCNNAMGLFSKLKGKEGAPKNPRTVAEAIVANLPSSPAIAEKPSLAGPGFINVRLGLPWLSKRIVHMLQHGAGCWAPVTPYKRAVVDFSSPNVAKQMHVGHLRSTIIGYTIAATLEFCNIDVLRINHTGDWGTQFGMLIQHIAETREGGLGSDALDEDVVELEVLYKASKGHFDEDPEFKLRAQQAVKKLQGGDPEFLAAWERICAASRRAFDSVYERLGVKITERGESFYNPLLPGLVQEMVDLGIAEESDGAKVIWVEGIKAPFMIQKRDGGYGYDTTDLAAIRHRLQDERGDWLIYVVDSGQGQHFEQVFGAARKAGILPQDKKQGPRVEFVGFGLVMGEDGKRIKTRSGASVKLVELLDEARERCRVTIKERRGDDISEEELEASACAMGYGAVKYSDLKNHRTTNYRFSFDDMLDLRGNTAVYMLYAHARIASIIRKVGKDPASLFHTAELRLEHPAEVTLAMHIARFPEAVELVLDELAPNRLTEYVYDLAEKFSGFYTECKVAGSEYEDSRLLLCEATAVIMRQTFKLLGITPLDRL
ncbi:hypothetical protein WJX73_001024 [Symbiochloris irregularis]|uniref:arginine--tRNA ligase n=1 Tax=Symbiochloris irregularis TaxID=706552 RepID=A0AAW1PV28_9CHLO